MLADAHKMLVDAHKVQKCKVWVKGFPTHNFACILDKNSLKYVEFNPRAFFAFLQKSKKFCLRHAKMMKNHESLRFTKNTPPLQRDLGRLEGGVFWGLVIPVTRQSGIRKKVRLEGGYP